MRFCKCLAVVLMGLGCAVAARAQAGVYVGYTATQLSGIPCLLTTTALTATPPVTPLQCTNGANGAVVGAQQSPAQSGVVNPSGIQGGAYYDFRTVGPMRLGVDLRGGDYHSNKSATSSAGGKNATGLDDVLLGLKGSFHTRYSWLSPYVQVSAGYARSNATILFGYAPINGSGVPGSRYEDNFLMYEGFAGVDIHVFSMIDLRPIELGIGNMNRFGSGAPPVPGTGLPGDGPGSIGVKSIGAAIVFHMPSSQ